MGIFEPMDYMEITDEVWGTFFHVNVLSGNALAKFYLPHMLQQNFGRVILLPARKPLCLLEKCRSTA